MKFEKISIKPFTSWDWDILSNDFTGFFLFYQFVAYIIHLHLYSFDFEKKTKIMRGYLIDLMNHLKDVFSDYTLKGICVPQQPLDYQHVKIPQSPSITS